MTDRHEALRLADALERRWGPDFPHEHQAAALLREQHAEIERLRAAPPASGDALDAKRVIPHSGADESPPVFARRWSLARDGFGLERDDEGNYVHIDDALSVLHAAMAQEG